MAFFYSFEASAEAAIATPATEAELRTYITVSAASAVEAIADAFHLDTVVAI